MSFNAFMKFFTPKDRIFYNLFEQVGEVLKEMGDLLIQLVHEPDFEKRALIIRNLENLEHANDLHTHTTIVELGKNFITPFDREDIHTLTTSLDDVADHIYAVGKKINLYRVDPTDHAIQKMAALINDGVQELHKALPALRHLNHPKVLNTCLVKINDAENSADDLFDSSVELLYQIEPDAKEVMKRIDILQIMESCTDKIEDVANVMEEILIKYA